MTVLDRVALITGAGSEIGKASSRLLAAHGAVVVVHDNDESKAQELALDIRNNGGRVAGIYADMTNKNEVQQMVNRIVNQFGRIDILVNLYETSGNEGGWKWDNTLNANLIATAYVCKASAEYMKNKQYGRIINLSSIAWLGSPGFGDYAASKGGIVSYTRTLALELAKHHITANTICPGAIEDDEYLSKPQDEREYLAKLQPVHFVGKPEDIAQAVLFFASDESSYITGQTLFVCGGKSLYSSLSV